MRKLILVAVILAAASLALAQEEWEDLGQGRPDFRAAVLCTREPGLIYAASGQEVLVSLNSGNNWKPGGLFRKAKVNSLAFSPLDGKTIFAATSAGLFVSADRAESWRRAFKGKNYSEAQANAVFPGASRIFLATGAGLFISRDNARSWQKAGGKVGQEAAFAVAQSEKSVFAAGQSGVYKSIDLGENWEEVFSAENKEKGATDEPVEESEEKPCLEVRHLAYGQGRLYLATRRGVYRSADDGQSWERMPLYGLLSEDVRFVAVAEDGTLYCVAGSGIFKYGGERWEEVSLRLTAQDIRSLAICNNGVYAACKEGLFRLKYAQAPLARESGENPGIPDIKSVQQAAIEYAEVNNEKIKSWRKKASRKAFLPQVSVGVSRDASDLWHWEGGSTTKPDDDTLRRGRDTIEWDLRLSWDLSEIIWNNDQTSIDSRQRLMVELRHSYISLYPIWNLRLGAGN